MASAEMRPMGFTELLDRTFTLYRRNFLLFVSVMVVPHLVILAMNLLPEVLKSAMITGAGSDVAAIAGIGLVIGNLLLLIVYFAMMALAQAATVFAVSEITLGRPTTAKAAYARIRGKLWRMVDVIFSSTVRIILGFVLLIIPGIILLLRYSVAVPVAVVEDLKAKEALRRSTSLTEGRRSEAFLILFMAGVLSWIGTMLFLFPVTILVAVYAQPGEPPLWLTLLANCASLLSGVLVGPIGTIAMALFYYDCRVRKEAFDLQVMLSSLTPATGATASQA